MSTIMDSLGDSSGHSILVASSGDWRISTTALTVFPALLNSVLLFADNGCLFRQTVNEKQWADLHYTSSNPSEK
jgi:hypothetical protein